MTVPAVTITELDGALGVLPSSAGALFAVVGVSEKGPLDTPATYARVLDLVTDFGYGPMVEAAAHAINRYGKPVVVVRTGQSTAAAASAVTQTGSGTSVATVDLVETTPLDDYEVVITVVTGGTVGIGPVLIRYSLDGGRTNCPVTDLGTASSFEITGTGVTVDLAAGTLVAGDTISFTTTASLFNSGEITSALTALGNSAVNWEQVLIAGPLDDTLKGVVDGLVSGFAASGKYHNWFGNARVPDPGETEAAYLTALNAALTADSLHGAVCAGACRYPSGVSGRSHRRPVSFVAAARHSNVDEDVNVADVNLGALNGIIIRDTNGNPDEHDEFINPGLDDAGFMVLRTWDQLEGVYINRPTMFSPAGSDFDLVPHRRVMNLASRTIRPYMVRRLNKSILVDSTTGFILEEEAREIEAGGLGVLQAALLAKPKASAVQFVLSRTDNILSTSTLTGTVRVTPLGYPEFIELDIGFLNPALQTTTV